jgi:hypothetical protein
MVEDEDRTGAIEAPAAPADVADEPAVTASPGPRGSRLPWIVATIAVLALVATVIVAAVMITDARQTTAGLADVEQAAGEFALALTTWDASDGMADTREQLREAGTESFATDVDQLFGGTDDLATLEELGARSSGEVRDVLVQSIDGDEAEALAVVIQRVATEVTEGEEVSLRYALIGMRREGGAWRVEQVELVVDALQEAAGRADETALPGFGDTPAPEDDETEDAP